MINREDMLELTRRMTPSRNCFARIAGAYMDKEGYEDGSFNIHFGKLSASETKKNLEMAKTIPFSKTNEQLKRYKFSRDRKNSLWPMLYTLKQNELKEDGILSVFYELMGENYKTDRDYAIFMFYGSYDIPLKAADKEWLEGSEEIYDFIICAVAPLIGESEPGKPEFGFLFPAFKDRSGDSDLIDIFHADPNRVQTDVMEKILGVGL